jgi:hypothetical protein
VDNTNLCLAPRHLVSGECCPRDMNYLVSGSCSACPANQSLVSGLCCPNDKPYVVGSGSARVCSACPVAGESFVSGTTKCCPANRRFVVNNACSACPANQSMVNGERCCPNSQPHLVGSGSARACSACPANQSLVSGLCCPNDKPYVVGSGSTRSCSKCRSNQKEISGQCCALTDKFVIGGQCVQEKCLGYKMDFKMIRTTGVVGDGKYDDIVDTNSDTPSCLDTQLKKAYSDCKGYYTAPMTNGMVDYYKQTRWIDDCVLRAFTDRLEYWERTGMRQFRSGTTYITNDILNDRVENDQYTSFYFDKNCNILSNQDVPEERACLAAKITYESSPISLLLNSQSENLDRNSVVVKFKLSPSSEEYVVWKASDEAPLLVYDPTHSGEISSYTQLFGEWTFGGRVEASLVSQMTDKESPRTAWEDGYSALSTLDINMDGKIAGDELSDLSLWFDTNRNAISESGEVRSLAKEGIVTLYYKNKVKNQVTGDIKVELGFERELKDKLVTGSTVDWYGVVGKTGAELVQRNNALRALCQSGPAVEGSEEQSSEIASLEAPDPGFTGVWVWHTDDSDPEKVVGGVLAFESSESGKFKGTSIIEVSADDSVTSFSSVLSKFNIIGGLERGEAGKADNIIFKVRSNDGVRLESKATLSEDKNTLTGQTSALRGSGDEEEVLTKYSWVANRYKE